MTLNAKDKGRRGEYDFRDLVRKIFGVKAERMPGSGAFAGFKGDMDNKTMPDVLKGYGHEIKYEVKPRILAYIEQCKREFNSNSMWMIHYRLAAEKGIPENFITFIPTVELLGLLLELQELRAKDALQVIPDTNKETLNKEMS